MTTWNKVSREEIRAKFHKQALGEFHDKIALNILRKIADKLIACGLSQKTTYLICCYTQVHYDKDLVGDKELLDECIHHFCCGVYKDYLDISLVFDKSFYMEYICHYGYFFEFF